MTSRPRTASPAVRQANKRGAARLAAVQALYQMDVAGSGVLEIAAEYEAFRLGKEVDGALYREADAQWFRAILSGVVENQKTVDPVIRQALTEDWPLSRLDSTLRAILRAGVYEMMKRDDVPVAVIVSEYVDIAKAFYAEDEPKLVNAVLDRVVAQAARRGPRQGRFVTAAPAEREARRTAIILVGVAGDRRLGGRGRVFARRAGRPASARRRQVARHRAGHRLQCRRRARRVAGRRDHPRARPAQRLHDGRAGHRARRRDRHRRAFRSRVSGCLPSACW